MSLTRQIAHNTIFQLVGKIISTFLGIIVIGLLTRYLGAEKFGYYSTVIAFLQIFAVLLDLGLYIILIKKISEPSAQTDHLVNNIFTLRFFSAIIFLGLAPLASLAFPYPTIVKLGIALTSLSYLFVSLNQVLTGLFQKNLKMNKVALAEVLGRIVLLGATALVLFFKLGLLSVLVAVILGSFVNFLYVFMAARRFVKIRFVFHWSTWRNILAEAWPIGLSVAFNLIYFKGDTVILSLYQPAADVGIYGATYKVLEILITLPAMFAGLVMPLLTTAFALGDTLRFQKLIQRSVNFLILMSLPLIVGVQFVAKPLMLLIAGNEFAAAGNVLRILVVATGIIFVGSLFGNAVVSVNKQKSMIWVYFLVAAISLTGYLILIPRYSYYGAAAITVLSEFLIMLGSALMVRRAIRFRLDRSGPIRILLATLAMASCLWLFRESHWLVLILVGFISYSLFLVLFKGISRAEIKEILSLRG
ncbi:MAG: flippase [Patescibacteria group bacterium]|nr:flippase [Patescibacteria group bacterium]